MSETLFETRPHPIVSLPNRCTEEQFDWSAKNKDIIVPRQLATAVYRNQYDQIVIRQEGEWDSDGDPFMCFSPNNVPALIERLKAVLEGKE